MIIQFILEPIFWIIKTFLGFLPTFEIEGEFESAIQAVFSLIETVGYFLPLNHFMLILGLYLSFYGLIFMMSIVNWLIKKIPTVS